MEEFFLGTFLANDKLDIIDEKNIIISVFFTEFRGGNIIFIPDRIDQLVGKLLTGNIENLGLRIIFQDKMSDRMH